MTGLSSYIKWTCIYQHLDLLKEASMTGPTTKLQSKNDALAKSTDITSERTKAAEFPAQKTPGAPAMSTVASGPPVMKGKNNEVATSDTGAQVAAGTGTTRSTLDAGKEKHVTPT
jgi:hypothetical protein